MSYILCEIPEEPKLVAGAQPEMYCRLWDVQDVQDDDGRWSQIKVPLDPADYQAVKFRYWVDTGGGYGAMEERSATIDLSSTDVLAASYQWAAGELVESAIKFRFVALDLGGATHPTQMWERQVVE